MVRTRVRRLVALMIAAVALSLVVGFVAGRAVAAPSGSTGPRVYLVRPGDTLWDIAAGLAGPRGDPRPVVDRLVRENGLGDGTILPGQRLALPSA